MENVEEAAPKKEGPTSRMRIVAKGESMAQKKKPAAKKKSARPRASAVGKVQEADAPEQQQEPQPAIRHRIRELLNELSDEELNVLMYQVENSAEKLSPRKLARVASAPLNRPAAIDELEGMLIDYHIEQHPNLANVYLKDKSQLRNYFYDYVL
jgi:hypothetical protein